MRKDRRIKLHILLFVSFLLLMACPSFAENDEPLTLTVEADPECLLSEAGDMTFFRFTVKNNLDEPYVLQDMTLQGDLLSVPKLITDSIEIKANDVLEFTLENVRIEEFAFDIPLSFQLVWYTTAYGPDDEELQEPIISEHIIEAPILIERFVEPVMTVSAEPNETMARKGDTVAVTYTLINDTKFDMTNITLQDPGIPQPNVPLDKNVLMAGERIETTVDFQMGTDAVELNPSVQYTVRGVESKVSAANVVTVEYVSIDFRMEVEKYPATAEGTLFRITLINGGSHPMTDIRIVDEIGTVIADGLPLDAGREKTISCTVPSAAAAGSVRYISFEATGLDTVGGTVRAVSPGYEVLPFVDSDQVRLNMSVTLTDSAQTDDGSNRLKLLFEIRNDSRVPIANAVIMEADYFRSMVNEYAFLSTGTTTFEKEFVVPAGTRSLTFVLTAMDPAQTQYASIPMTLDLSPLAAPKPTNPPAIKPGKTVDITGTIYDTERYVRLFRMTALIVLALTLMFLLLSLIFQVAETNIRRLLPRESMARPFGPRKSHTGPLPEAKNADPVHDLFGYTQPAKLRYMERTDRMAAVHSDGTPAEPIPPALPPLPTRTLTVPGVQRNTGSIRREGDITAVPIHKKERKRPVMMTTDETLSFKPVHEGQAKPEIKSEENAGSAAPVSKASAKQETQMRRPKDAVSVVAPRVVETKPAPRIVPRQKLEIIRVSQP